MQDVHGWVEIRVGIAMMCGVTITENYVIVMPTESNGIVTSKDTFHTMNIKILRNKMLIGKTFIRKTCLYAFSIRLKGHTKF